MGGGNTVWAARILPVILIGIIGYISWVVTEAVVYENFFRADRLGAKRVGAGIAVLVIYWILFILVTSSFGRLLWTIFRHPGFIRRDDQDNTDLESEKKARTYPTEQSVRLGFSPPRLGDILSKDVFVCQPDGMPKWCETCKLWRPDRSRHCREKDTCVLKLDHFCPWVGGIVSERSMKYFILFNGYTFLYTIFDWVLASVCIARVDPHRPIDGNWIAMLILGLFFMGLTGGIGYSALLNSLTNHTTPENIAEPSGHTWHFAIRVPTGTAVAEGVRTVTFPDLTDADYDTLVAHLKEREISSSASSSSGAQNGSGEQMGSPAARSGSTFAIVESDTFCNPWYCGMYENWCQVMGHSIAGWFVPFHVGNPWLSSDAYTAPSFFPTDIDVKAMKAKAGLATLSSEEESEYKARLERRRRFPYWLGGAGAPRKQWAASRAIKEKQPSS